MQSMPKAIKHLILMCFFIAISGIIYVAVVELNFFGQDSKELVFAHDMPKSSVHHQSAIFFKKLVEQKSKGSLKVRIYPNQTLGSDKHAIDLVKRGEAAIALPPTAKLTDLFPEFKILDIPFLFANKRKFYDYLDNRFLDQALLNAHKKQGLIPMGFWDSGAKVITSKSHMAHPDLFIGKRFRVMKSDALSEMVHQLGAIPIHIDFIKIKQAIEDDVIDIQSNPLVSVIAREIYQVHPHIHKTYHSYLSQQMIFSSRVREDLSENQWTIIELATRETTKFQRELINGLEQNLLKTAETTGATVHEVSDPIKQAYINKFSGMYKSRSKRIIAIRDYVHPGVLEAIESSVTIPINLSLALEARKSASAVIRGVSMALNEVNGKGGLLGKSLNTHILNHGGFPDNGLKNMKIISKLKNVPAVIGGMHSPVVLAERNYVNQNKINYLIPWAAASPIIPSDPSVRHSIFRFSVRDSWVAPFILEKAIEGSIGIALVLENTAWGKSNQKALLKNLEASGFKNTYTGWFKWGDKSFSKILSEISSRSIDTIVFVGNAPEGTEFIKDLSTSELKVKVYSHWGILGGNFYQDTKNHLSKVDLEVIHTFAYEPESEDVKIRKFWQAYKDQFKVTEDSEVHAPFATVHAYELTRLLIEAIKKAKSFDKEKVHTALKRVSLDGIHKKYKIPFIDVHEALSPDDLRLGKIMAGGLVKENTNNTGE